MGQQGEAGSPGMAIYKLAFSFGRLLSSCPPSTGRKKVPLSQCQMGWGRALTRTMGWIMHPASGGLAVGHPGRSSCRQRPRGNPTTRAAGQSEAGRGPGLAHSSPPLMPQPSRCGSLEEWGGGMGRRNVPALCSNSPSFPGLLQHCCQGREDKPAQGLGITPMLACSPSQ